MSRDDLIVPIVQGPFNRTIEYDKSEYPILVSDNTLDSGGIFFHTDNNEIKASLLGDPSTFPFDRYHVNFLLAIPLGHIQGIYQHYFDALLNTTWNPSMIIVPSSSPYTILPIPIEVALASYGGVYFTNLKIQFERNYLASEIIVPIIATFYLLGAIFILENSLDNSGLPIRLTITLAVFAFLFTFSPIMNQYKPLTVHVPTVADSLITVLILSTITFTISSVISNSSVISRRFPKGYVWIDMVSFFFIGILVVYFLKPYPIEIIRWLIPIILIGLGYGLLFKQWIRIGQKPTIK